MAEGRVGRLLRSAEGAAYWAVVAPLAARLPAALGYRIACLRGDWEYRSRPGKRAELMRNLRRLPGDEPGPDAAQRLARQWFRFASCQAIDVMRMRYRARPLRRLVEIRGREHLEAALAGGKGAILCSAHFGSYDCSFSLLGASGFPVTTIGRWQHNYTVGLSSAERRFWDLVYARRLRRHRRRPNIEPWAGRVAVAVQAAAILRANEVVTIAIDAPPLEKDLARTVEVPFLGRRARLLPGAVTLAQLTGAPLLMGFMYRTADYRHQVLEISAPVPCPAGEDAATAFARCAAEVSAAIRRSPAHWVYWASRGDLANLGLISPDQDGAPAVTPASVTATSSPLLMKGFWSMKISLPSRKPEGYSDVTSPFAMDDQAFRALGYRLVDTLGAYLEALPGNPVYQPLPGEVRRQIEEMRLPTEGMDPEAILQFFTQRVLPYGRGQNHPCFAAFVDPAASKLSMLAAFASAVTNTSGAGGEYAAIYLEQLAVRWLMELIGFPRDGSDGVLLGGGSDANRHCMEVARHWGARVNGWDIRDEGLQGHPRLTMYMSTEGHSCLEKAAFTLGLGSPRKVAVDHDFRIDLDDLRAAVAADRRAGHRPFLVVANAGSVKTGAIDPFDALAEFCRQERLWLHVDGAYGGFGALDPRLARWFAGMEHADSVAIDPHKWMAVAIGCSCAMVRQGELLQDTYKLVPSYLSLPQGKGFAGHIWYSHRSAEQTRDSARALKTFWNIQQAGRAGLVSHVRRHVDLARHMEKIIEASPDLELLATGPLTAVCFRYVPVNWQGNDQGLDLLNQAIMADVQTGGRAFLAGTDIRGRFALRSCALHYALDEEHVESIVGAVREAGSFRVSAGLAANPPVPELAVRGDAGRLRQDQRAEDMECVR
jgi:aromatic-L-amino-acid/L-tryptophan decarboxylase